MNVLRMRGCRPEPLASYLKALGVHRLVGEQKDPEAKGCWKGDHFELRNNLTRQELIDFFVLEYRPTPIVAPWNGRGGFRTDVNRASEQILREFRTSRDGRLQLFRATIDAGHRVFRSAVDREWDRTKDKAQWVSLCRATFPDEAIGWLDAIVVLTTDNPVFPPLLGGAGGVLGSMDLSINFMHNLRETMVLPGSKSSQDRSKQWLSQALFGEGSAPLISSAAGQFDPGASGGANSSPMGDAGGLINPWDYILLLEGALLFASAAARRLTFDESKTAALPFMVDSSPVGYASGVSQEGSRGEAWLPLWSRPVTSAEATHFIGEGRSEWRGRQARTGLDMAKAAANLGVDRGIEGFSRYAFLERHGQSNLAIAIGRVAVRNGIETPLLAELDPWIDAVRSGKDQPAGVNLALKGVDKAMFELTQRSGARQLQDVLVAVAEVESALARSPGFRGKNRLPPLSGRWGSLSAKEWLPRLDDGSAEMRLAAAAASQHDDNGVCLRWLLRPVQPRKKGGLDWANGSAPVPGFGVTPIDRILAASLVQRARGEQVAQPESQDHPGNSNWPPAFRWRLPVPINDVSSFLARETDDGRLARLLSAFLLLNWRGSVEVGWFDEAATPGLPLEPAWALLAPFFHCRPLSSGEAAEIRLMPIPSWATLLTAGRISEVAREALLRLRMARLDPAVNNVKILGEASPPGVRLAASMMFPISSSAARVLLRRTVPDPVE